LLLGGGPYLRSMIDTADGAVPSSAGDPRHTELRTALAGFETLRATMVLSDQQRAIMAEEIKKSGGRAPTALGTIRGAAHGARLVDKQATLLAIVRTDGNSKRSPSRARSRVETTRSGVTAQTACVAPRPRESRWRVTCATLGSASASSRSSTSSSGARVAGCVAWRARAGSAAFRAPAAPPRHRRQPGRGAGAICAALSGSTLSTRRRLR
jgi:hypothetical protein